MKQAKRTSLIYARKMGMQNLSLETKNGKVMLILKVILLSCKSILIWLFDSPLVSQEQSQFLGRLTLSLLKETISQRLVLDLIHIQPVIAKSNSFPKTMTKKFLWMKLESKSTKMTMKLWQALLKIKNTIIHLLL